jgi:hypothetical protein
VIALTWWHRYLMDPSRLALMLGRWLLPVAAVAAVVWLACWVRRSRARAFAVRHARWVEIRPPASARPEDSARFWLGLARLLRRRRRGWAPHVAFELAWDGPALRLGVWVPALVPAAQVARIAETGWPGCSAEIQHGGGPGLPPSAVVAGGELAAAGGRDWLPLRDGHQADPLRAVLAGGLYLGAGEAAVVQVAARLASGSRLARARAGAQGRRAGAPGAGGIVAEAARRLVLGVLNLVTGLISTGSSGPRPASPPGWQQQDVFGQAQQRAGVRKLTSPPLWEVAVRYAAASTASGEGARQRVRAHCDGLGAALGVFSDQMDLADRPVRDPAAVLASRRLRRGLLVSTPELAALAHVPYDPGTPGLAAWGARPVAPPAGIHRLPWSA